MNVEGLRYAHAVSQTKSFSAAARAYGVTQPALSNGIARLEEQLGLKLFDRSPRGVKPTANGALVLPLIERAVAAFDAIAVEAERLTNPGPEIIHLGVSPLIGSDLVAAAFNAARSLARPKTLVLREADLDGLYQGLSVGELDLIIVPAVEATPQFHHRVIHREPVVVLDPTASAQDGPLELETASASSYILVPGTCGLRTFTTGLFSSEELALQTYPGEASNVRVLEEWARLGLGAALLPRSKVSDPGLCRPLVRSGLPVEIAYEAVWGHKSALRSDLRDLVEAMVTS